MPSIDHVCFQVYYIDYLKLCKNYGLTNVDVPKIAGNEPEEAADASAEQRIVPVAAAR